MKKAIIGLILLGFLVFVPAVNAQVQPQEENRELIIILTKLIELLTKQVEELTKQVLAQKQSVNLILSQPLQEEMPKYTPQNPEPKPITELGAPIEPVAPKVVAPEEVKIWDLDKNFAYSIAQNKNEAGGWNVMFRLHGIKRYVIDIFINGKTLSKTSVGYTTIEFQGMAEGNYDYTIRVKAGSTGDKRLGILNGKFTIPTQ